MADEPMTSIGLPITKKLNEQLNLLCPRGTKAAVLRKLIDLLIEAQIELNSAGSLEFISDLAIRGHCKLTVKRNGGGDE